MKQKLFNNCIVRVEIDFVICLDMKISLKLYETSQIKTPVAAVVVQPFDAAQVLPQAKSSGAHRHCPQMRAPPVLASVVFPAPFLNPIDLHLLQRESFPAVGLQSQMALQFFF